MQADSADSVTLISSIRSSETVTSTAELTVTVETPVPETSAAPTAVPTSAPVYYPASTALNGITSASTSVSGLKVVDLGSNPGGTRIPHPGNITSSYIPAQIDSWYELDLIVPPGETEKTFTFNVCGATSGASSWRQYGPALMIQWLE